MLQLTRPNGKPLELNCAFIEFVESTPDTLISLTTGQKFLVQEPAGEVIARSLDYYRSLRDLSILAAALRPAGGL